MSFIEFLKPVTDFPDYEVDRYGNVYGKDGHRLSQCLNRTGYYMVKLCNSGYEKNCSVHRLVADAFCPGRDYSLDVNHIDCNKQNNFADNLEWCTRGENIKHAYTHNLLKSQLTDADRRLGAKISGEKKSKPVKVLETGIVYPSVRECAQKIGGYINAISNCCNGHSKQHHGYHFEWVKKESYSR